MGEKTFRRLDPQNGKIQARTLGPQTCLPTFQKMIDIVHIQAKYLVLDVANDPIR